jgi:hypothetical protein
MVKVMPGASATRVPVHVCGRQGWALHSHADHMLMPVVTSVMRHLRLMSTSC